MFMLFNCFFDDHIQLLQAVDKAAPLPKGGEVSLAPPSSSKRSICQGRKNPLDARWRQAAKIGKQRHAHEPLAGGAQPTCSASMNRLKSDGPGPNHWVN